MAAALFQPFPEQRIFLLFWKGLNFVIGSGYWILYPDFARIAPPARCTVFTPTGIAPCARRTACLSQTHACPGG